jgi:tetratricopeptide (TPR) repeat protein
VAGARVALTLLLVVVSIGCGPPLAEASARDRWPFNRHAALLRHADTLATRNPTLAHAYLDSTIAAARARGDSGLVMVMSLSGAAIHGFYEGRFEQSKAEARPWVATARAYRDTSSWCLALRTIAYADLVGERFASTSAVYEQMAALARRAGLTTQEGHARIGLSYVAMRRGRAADAEAGYRTALRLLEGRDPRAARTARAGLASSLYLQARPDDSRREYERVLAESRAAGDLRNTADALNDLGDIEFEYGDPSRAVPMYRSSAATQQRVGRWLPSLYSVLSVGLCLGALGRGDEAVAIIDSVATAARTVGAFDLAARALGELGRIRRQQGRYSEAEANLMLAVTLRDSISKEAWAHAAAELARVQILEGRPELARRTAQQALAKLPRRSPLDSRAVVLCAQGLAAIAAGAPAEALSPLRESARLLAGFGGAFGVEFIASEAALAQAHVALGRRDSGLVHFRRASEAWEQLRAKPSDLAWRESFDRAAGEVYGPFAAEMLDPRRGGRADARADEAFATLQRFRSRTLEDAMRGAEARTGLPRASLAQIEQSTLRPGEVLLDVFSAPDTTFLFAVTREGIRVGGAMGSSRLAPRLRRFRDLLSAGETDRQTIVDASTLIGADLFGSVADLVARSRQILVSAGSLAEFPLAQLRLPGDSEPIAVSHRIAIVPSATLLAVARDSRDLLRAHRSGLLALSRDTDPAGRRLDGVTRESRWLARRFPGAQVRVNDGTRSLDAMLRGLESAEVLHIASHTRGIVAAPWRSGFLLGSGDGEDSYLTASRIARVPVNARVCVLASCSSAGAATNAEALPNLASAWLGAGASAVVATLWKVDDRKTAEFVRDLYEALARGETVGDAVASAQHAARTSRDRGEPRFWGGFVLLGDPEARVSLLPR